MSELRTVVDVDTGEILFMPKIKPKKKERWCRMFQIKLEEIAKDKELRGMPLSVYLFMVSKVDYDNICRFPQILIAGELDTTASYVSKSIGILRKKKIITEMKQRGTMVKAYSFNSKYIVKGKMPEEDVVDFDGEVIIEAKEKEIVKVTKPVFKGYDFDLFWIIYPKKVGKKECQKIWEKMKVSSEQFNAISYHLSLAYKDTEKKFMPNPATYLRGEKWNDEVITEAPKTGFDSEIPSWKRRDEHGLFTNSVIEGELN